MVLAQDITVEVSPDPLSLVLSVLAVIIATMVAVTTYVQGRAIRNIETREHEWQRIDRLSADIEVVRMREVEPRSSAGITRYSTRDWIRLRNTGRAEAQDVTWMMDRGSFKGKDVMLGDRRQLDVLHPGEHFDLLIAMSFGDPPEANFTVTWTDGNGQHTTLRTINL